MQSPFSMKNKFDIISQTNPSKTFNIQILPHLVKGLTMRKLECDALEIKSKESFD